VDGAWDAEAISEEAVIGYAEFTAGLEQAEDSVASGLTDLADGSSGDFSLGDDGVRIPTEAGRVFRREAGHPFRR